MRYRKADQRPRGRHDDRDGCRAGITRTRSDQFKTSAAERPRLALQVYADLTVFIDQAPGAAAARKRRLDDLDGAEFSSDCAVFAGTPGELADLLTGLG